MNDLENDSKKKDSKMYGNTAHNIYAQNNIGVESPIKLIEMLYEGILRFNAQAKKAIKDGDIEKRVYWINRSSAIITELISILDTEQALNTKNSKTTSYIDFARTLKMMKSSISAKLSKDIRKIAGAGV